MKIFISIASYRDPLLRYTVTEAYNNAMRKDDLVFAIVDQSNEQEALKVDSIPFRHQIRYLRISPEQSRGCCWARNVAQSMYEGEEFFLQIDSHMGFDPGWDVWLIERLQHLMQYHDKPILTLYPRSLKAKNHNIYANPLIKNTAPDEHVSCLVANNETAFENGECHIRCKGLGISSDQEYLHGYLIAGGFLFTLGEAVDEVPYDPHMFFSSEEPSMAVRLWTHGYSIFHTRNVPIYHYYGNEYRSTFWSKEDDKERPVNWSVHANRSTRRFRQLISGDNVGSYGLGTVRSLKRYIQWSGIDYSNYTLRRKPGDTDYCFTLDYRQPIHMRRPIDVAKGPTLSGSGVSGLSLSGNLVL